MSAAASDRSAVVLGGRRGLVGQALVRALEAAGWRVYAAGRESFDPFDTEALTSVLEREQAKVLFNTVAYTAVDAAEEDSDAAFRLNMTLPAMLARTARAMNVLLVHYSTDFVFSGRQDIPYTPEDTPNPQSVYGRSKLAGEREIQVGRAPEHLIIRTSWLFGPGKSNFVEKILSLAAQRDELRIVADQIGSPSYTVDLARNTVALVEAEGRGIYHLANSGHTSWCGLAAEAVSVAGLNCKITPITSDEYPQKAKRPAYSVLDLEKYREATGITPRPWCTALRDYIFQDLQDFEESDSQPA